MSRSVEIRQSEQGHRYALLRRDPEDDIEAVAGPFEVVQNKTRASWRLFVNALDEDDWTRDTQIVEWANEHEWGPVLFVDEEFIMLENDDNDLYP